MGSGGNTANCAQYAKDYETELPAAKKCNLASLVNECTTAVPSSLGCTGDCPTYVSTSSSSKLKSIYSDWQNAGCEKGVPVCPNGCRNPPSSGSCTSTITTAQSPTDGTSAAVAPIGNTAMCIDVFGGPAPL